VRKLTGTSRQPGVAMAMAVVVNVQGGLSGFPASIMKQGIKSLRMNLPESEQPEVIMVCDLLAIGSSIRIPGVHVTGIIAEGNDEPAVPLAIPCIAGVSGLLQAVGDEEFAIVDADSGTIYIDPDVQTVIGYQNLQSPEPASRVFLESSDVPAQARDGRLVTVMAIISTISEAELAISQGADALVVRFAELLEQDGKSVYIDEAETDLAEMLVAMAAGKPVHLLVSAPGEHLIELAKRISHYAHISFVEPTDAPDVLDVEAVGPAVKQGVQEVVIAAQNVSAAKDVVRTTGPEVADGTDIAG
jgi:hypothetical protein